jgi:hypothetical protein
MPGIDPGGDDQADEDVAEAIDKGCERVLNKFDVLR